MAWKTHFLSICLHLLAFSCGGAQYVCPQPELLPDHFKVERLAWSFWAGATVQAEVAQGAFGYASLQTIPWFSPVLRISLPSGQIWGTARSTFCLPFQHCDFDLFDCNNKLIVSARVKQLPALHDKSSIVEVLEFEHGDGLGRSSPLFKIGLPLLSGGIQPDDVSIIVRDSGGHAVATMKHNVHQAVPWSWEVEMPSKSDAVMLKHVAIADPRLMMVIAFNEFGFAGFFGPGLSVILSIVIVLVGCYGLIRGLKVCKGRQDEPTCDFLMDYCEGERSHVREQGFALSS
eukprot:CAMPEP_0115058384 /NCGR_PEP_ID=MMETSP0227-20121206/6318_1 /TAXON_ID=89957 /ORGANISM="Polarella glacialis, Strain CCMP 1383" /LENGTH=287 /DNA_ID=CAMNT_0002443361 /DNA_START=102 /DNA_END=962 /DNA_ORIENTATION=+